MSGDAIGIASANLCNGGVSPDGSTARRDQSAAALRDWQPHLVLVQELYAPGEDLARRHFRALANATGLEPCAFGLPRGSKRLRTGILADTATLEIVDDGPPPVADTPYRAEAVTKIRATGTVLATASAVTCYRRQPNPGSDHQMLMVSLDPAALACVVCPGPRP